MRRPITQKAKSPLKAVEMTSSSTATSTGEDIISDVDNSVNPPKAGGGTQTTDVDGYLSGVQKRFPNSTGQQLVDAGYISSAYADRFPSSFTEKVVTPGETITETKTNSYTPQVRDETTAITPWENRFNMRTSRQSERFARNEAKRDLRRNAKEAARDTRQDGGSFLEGRQARRDIMTGKSFQNDMQENLYNASRGLNADQNRVFSTDAQQSQFEQAATRGEKVLGTRRDMDIYDAGTSKGVTTVKNLQAQDPDYKLKLGNNEKVTTSGGDAAKANSGAPTTNKVNGTGASSKASMRPGVGLNAEFKGASVPSVDLVASKKARQVAQAEVGTPDAVTVTPKDNSTSKQRKTRAPKGEKELSKRQIRRQERKENTTVSTGKLGSDLGNSVSIPTPDAKGASKLAPTFAPPKSSGGNFAGTGMSKSEVSDLSEALTDRKNANVREANKSTAASIQANTGTADRASYNRTSADIDGTPTREDSDRSIISAAQMRYESNVGIKKSAPMKKGYFKGR
jgi:hypothetical protein